MKKFITLVMALVLSLAACLGLTACGGTNTVDPRADKTITVAYTDYAPMNYTEEGVFKGFDTELAIMVFNTLGYNVKFKLIEWSNKYVELNSGTVDCIWNGFTSNGSDDGVPRSESVDFSFNYMLNAQCIVRKTNTAEVTAYAQFVGTSVAFEGGSAGQSLIEDNVDGNVMKQSKISQMDAITAVNMGQCDYAVVDFLLAQEVCSASGYEDLVMNTGIEIAQEFYAIGFKKGSTLTAKVNMALAFFAETGYLTELATKYGIENQVITDFYNQI